MTYSLLATGTANIEGIYLQADSNGWWVFDDTEDGKTTSDTHGTHIGR